MSLFSHAPTPQTVEQQVSQLVSTTLHKKNVAPDEPLFSTQDGFDSFGLMEFVLQLEETFDISIPDDDLDPDTFYSVKAIVGYLVEQLN